MKMINKFRQNLMFASKQKAAILICGILIISGLQTAFPKHTGNTLSIGLAHLFSPKATDTGSISKMLTAATKLINQKPAQKANLDQALVLLKEAMQMSHSNQTLYWQFKTQMLYGSFYHVKGLHRQQAGAYENAISIAKKLNNKHLEAKAWFDYYKKIPDTVADYRNRSFYQRAENAYKLYNEIANTFDEHYKTAQLLREMADFHLEEEKFDLAIQELHEVISMHQKYKLPDLPMAYDLLSAVYNRKGELSKALECALKSVQIAEANHEEVYVTYLNRIGAAYESMNKPKESIQWYTKSYQLTAKNDPYLFVPAYVIATQLIKLGQAEKALKLLKDTWKGVSKRNNDLQYFMYLGFGESYTALKNYKMADEYFKRLLSPSTLHALANPFRTSVYFAASEFYFAQKDYISAAQNAEKARLNQITMTLPRQIRLNEILYKIDLALNHPARAMVYLQHYHKLKDSMLSQDNLNAIDRLQVEFQATQKENENEILRKKSQLQNQELKRTQLIKNVTIGGLAFLTIVLALLYGRFSLKKKHHNILINKKAELDLAYSELEHNITLKNKLIEEKEGLIREVHHRVKNNLQLTISLLNSQSYFLHDPAAIEAIKESQHRLKSIALIHQKLYQNQNVSTVNIQPYISELVAYLKESLGNDKKITFEQNIINLEMDVSKAIPLGLILNEAITNIFKYAFTNRSHGKIEISLTEADRRYLLLIKDNGVGFPAGFDYTSSNTLGIILMKGLSAQIDGIFSMTSEDGVLVSLTFENPDLSND